jgi:hypothetical protein
MAFALTALQFTLSLQLYGPSDPWAAVVSDAPIVSGRHPLHFDHAALGARAWHEAGDFSSFDPAFQAGYPKTAVYDGGARPMELAAVAAAGGLSPAAYKLAVLACSSLLPAGFWLAAGLLALGHWTRVSAYAIGVLVWWTEPGRRLLEFGDLNAMTLTVVTVLHLTALARYHARPGPLAWSVLFLTAVAGWYVNPTTWAGVSFLAGGYWLGVGRRHGAAWQVGFAAAQGGAVTIMLPWVVDWVRYWWVYLPFRLPPSPGRDWWTCATSALSSAATIDRLAYAALVLAGLVGSIGRLAGGRHRTAAWLFLIAGGVLASAAAGLLWQPLRPFGDGQFLFAAAGLAVVPAAHALGAGAAWLCASAGRGRFGFVLAVLSAAAAVACHQRGMVTATGVADWGPRPLELGLPAPAEAFARWARRSTTAEARILWEDRPGAADAGWTVLLARQAHRAFLGGLDADADLEHGFMTLKNGVLAGRPIGLWSDEELEGYCRRYNVGWVGCATDQARERFARFALAEPLPPPPGWDGRAFFAVRRPLGFLLKGTARELTLEPRRVVLADVTPENGEVLVSLHYQHCWRARPAWIKVEPEPDPYDPIPLLRLRTAGPVARITLTWDGP